MVLARFVLLAAVLLAASSVSAAEIIDLGPSDYRNFGSGGAHTSSGIRSSFGQTVRMPPTSLNTLSVTRNPVVPYASAAARMRPFTAVHPASLAASAAITGLFLAMEWYFDEEIGEWSVREIEQTGPETPTGVWVPGGGWTISSTSGISWPTKEAACSGLIPAYMSNTAHDWAYRAVEVDGGRFYCLSYRNGQPYPNRIGSISNESPSCPEGWDYNASEGTCERLGSVPVIQGEYSRLAGELPNLPADQVAEATGDAQRRYGMAPGYHDTQMSGPSSIAGPETTSTSTDPVTGDTIVTNTQTTTNITYGDTTITTTNTTVTNTYVNGNHTKTETTTETPGELPVEPSPGGAAGEWPGFCDWASVVCSFIEWFQEPFDAPEVEWPLIEDQDYEEEFDFTLAASCPEPYTIELALFPPVQFNWQPFCDLATFIRPLVLASAAIFAAFISLGIARARN